MTPEKLAGIRRDQHDPIVHVLFHPETVVELLDHIDGLVKAGQRGEIPHGVPQTTPAELDGVRAAFENWMDPDGKFPNSVAKNLRGGYNLSATSVDWNTWLAAVQWQQARPVQVDRTVENYEQILGEVFAIMEQAIEPEDGLTDGDLVGWVRVLVGKALSAGATYYPAAPAHPSRGELAQSAMVGLLASYHGGIPNDLAGRAVWHADRLLQELAKPQTEEPK